MFNLLKQPKMLSTKEAAKILQTTPEALAEFEKAYGSLQEPLPISTATPAALQPSEPIERIVEELLSDTSVFTYQRSKKHSGAGWGQFANEFHKRELVGGRIFPMPDSFLTKADVKALEEKHPEFRPQLTGRLMQRDMEHNSYETMLFYYLRAKKHPNEAMDYYNRFRQGLDILDLDPVLYAMLGENKNSISYWLPYLMAACYNQDFFKIPNTTVAKVPLPILQLTRIDYDTLTDTTKCIVDRWAERAFALNPLLTYFVKTGIYSNKYDFRNCKIEGAREVKEIGEYLLYIHHTGVQMASPLNNPCIYGAATTRDWIVREYIEDAENNPCIYHGMPLHTEYRVFVDCDTDEILSVCPYWDPTTMKTRFEKCSDADAADMKHDAVIYRAHEEKLMQRYEESKDKVVKGIKRILPFLSLPGQWSIDVMQNGDDFWLIDMGLAEVSAFKETIPVEKRKKTALEWMLPEISND